MATLRRFDACNDLKVLFLARHGPGAPKLKNEGQYPQYHEEIYRLLRRITPFVVPLHSVREALPRIPEFDYVFALFNRLRILNPEVFIAAICEYYRVSYLGASPQIRGVAEDKHLAKIVALQAGLPTCPWVCLSPHHVIPERVDFEGPYFIKPRFGAASEHISEASLQTSWSGVQRLSAPLLKDGVNLIVESFAPGRNLTVPILGDETPIILPVVELHTESSNGILTYTEKLQENSLMDFSVILDKAIEKTIRSYVQSFWQLISPADYFRMDFRYDEASGRLSFLEFNICCDISSFGSFMYAAKQVGLTQEQVLNHIMSYSVERQQRLREQLDGI